MASVTMLFLLFNLITLVFNLAESVGGTMPGNGLKQPVFRRFEWRNLNGAPVPEPVDKPESLDADDDDINPSQRAVYWIPTTCDSFNERGYTCLACGESLHCMAGGFGLKAVCYGRRPFCHNGVCSATRGEKCGTQHQLDYQEFPQGPNVTSTITQDGESVANSTR